MEIHNHVHVTTYKKSELNRQIPLVDSFFETRLITNKLELLPTREAVY